MPSTVIVITAVASLVGFILNTIVLFLVLSRGRKIYHYLFAGVLFTCAVWDLGVFLMTVWNNQVDELILYGYIVFIVVAFLPALIYHFTLDYLGKSKKKTTIVLWTICTTFTLLIVTGWGGRIMGAWRYEWGNIWRPDDLMSKVAFLSVPVYFFATLSACWFLFQEIKRETSHVKRRHMKYILASFLAVTVATIKVMVVMGIDLPYVLPAGMLLNDLFVALIGVAIVKHQLFDITVIIKKGVIYSLLAALIIFVFSFSEHLLANYVGHLLGHESNYIHLLSIAIVIAILMPVKHRLEHTVEGYFAQKKLEF